jgi:hypothetical protein
MTELYRLQREPVPSRDLDSEQIDSWRPASRRRSRRCGIDLAAFDMRKEHVILRDATASTSVTAAPRIAGFEIRGHVASASTQLSSTLSGHVCATPVRFLAAIDGGETITKGNDVDTAPRDLLSRRTRLSAVADALRPRWRWLMVGEYWLDAANAHRYGGLRTAEPARAAGMSRPGGPRTVRVNNALDRDYCDRADFAFGQLPVLSRAVRAPVFAEVDWTVD